MFGLHLHVICVVHPAVMVSNSHNISYCMVCVLLGFILRVYLALIYWDFGTVCC